MKRRSRCDSCDGTGKVGNIPEDRIPPLFKPANLNAELNKRTPDQARAFMRKLHDQAPGAGCLGYFASQLVKEVVPMLCPDCPAALTVTQIGEPVRCVN